MITTALGALAWWQTANIWFGVGAISALLPWPWTLLAIMPTNSKLLAISVDDAGRESRHLLARWGQLHLVRTGLGCAATIAFLVGLIRMV